MGARTPRVVALAPVVQALGHWVTECRKHLGVTQEQVASESGISMAAISRIEQGKSLQAPFVTYLALVQYLTAKARDTALVLPSAAHLLTSPGAFTIAPLDERRALLLKRFDMLTPPQQELFWRMVLPFLEYYGEWRRGPR